MHRHKPKTRQRRQKQLERARGEDTPERGSVAAAAAKQRVFLIGKDGTKTPVTGVGSRITYERGSDKSAKLSEYMRASEEEQVRAAAAEAEEMAEEEVATAAAAEEMAREEQEEFLESNLGFIERHRIGIFLSLLLGLLVIYIPGAREKALGKIAHNASWSVYFSISNREKLTILDNILTSDISDKIIEYLARIQEYVPNLFSSVSDVLIGVKGALSSRSLTGITLLIINKINIIAGIRNLYNYLRKPATPPAPGNLEPDGLQELMDYKEQELEDMSRGLTARDPEAIGKLITSIGGRSIRKTKYRKTKKRLSKKTKKKRNYKRGLSKKRRSATKSSKSRHRKNRRTRK
tara:strand:+ start:2052 stop:3098 length:1047 start_codon:yes stop_codon:yes gene_type:complete